MSVKSNFQKFIILRLRTVSL